VVGVLHIVVPDDGRPDGSSRCAPRTCAEIVRSILPRPTLPTASPNRAECRLKVGLWKNRIGTPAVRPLRRVTATGVVLAIAGSACNPPGRVASVDNTGAKPDGQS
jgi:hypothetical protein